MELKIWVEGFPRIVCGVLPSTTCEEVIRGLAHALQKTGRFTLLEQWRDTERELAPSDCPLRLLHRWGEYASEVRFSLRCGRNRTPRPATSPVKRSLSLAASPAPSQEPLERSPPPQTPSTQYSSLERKNMRWKPTEKSPLREALSNSLERRKRNQHPVARVAPSHHDFKQSGNKEELLQLVALQLERLQLQEECLSKLQSEIKHLEEQDAFLEKETGVVSQEISKLETQEQEMMAQLRDLEEVPWDERLRAEQDNSALLQSQMLFYQDKVYEMEHQLHRTVDKIQHLAQELENNAAEEEEEMRRQIEELQEELEQKEQQCSSTLSNLSQVDGQLQALDRSIEQQKAQIARLEDELKNTNMDHFRHTPEMVRLSLERRSATALLSTPKLTPSPSSARSTPTKRGLIFNADTLKEAVAMTTTDTLWV